MMVAHTLRRKTKMTATTSATEMRRVTSTSSNGGAYRLGTIAQNLDFERLRHRRFKARQFRRDAIDGFDDIGAGLLEDDQKDAALAVGPSCLFCVLGPENGMTDVADADGVPLR